MTATFKRNSVLTIVSALLISLFVTLGGVTAEAATQNGITDNGGYKYNNVFSGTKATVSGTSRYKGDVQKLQVIIYRELKEGEGQGPGYWVPVAKTKVKTAKSYKLSMKIKKGERYKVTIKTQIGTNKKATNDTASFKVSK